jgi:hypothetical protein
MISTAMSPNRNGTGTGSSEIFNESIDFNQLGNAVDFFDLM